jgi:hypothetical protein
MFPVAHSEVHGGAELLARLDVEGGEDGEEP